MKFYDKNGEKHKTLIGAVTANVGRKVDSFVRSKMPSYEETINENEHLYDAMDRYTVYPSKDGTATTTTPDNQSYQINSDVET